MNYQQIVQNIFNFINKIFIDDYNSKDRTDVPENSMNEILYKIVSHYNSGETKIYYPVRNDPTGTLDAYIGKNDDATNRLVADTIVNAASANQLDALYLAAVINQESQFSPACYNCNLSQANLVPNFLHKDIGISQFSGSFLGSKPGMAGLSQSEMEAKAHDATWAIPVMAQVYAGLILAAQKELTSDINFASLVNKLNTTELTDVQFLAALFYNRGQVGGINFIKTNNTEKIKHPYRCAVWYSAFTSYAKTKIFPK